MGLKKTRQRIVSRELAFRPGTPILAEDTAQLFKKSSLNIFNTKLFNFVIYRIDSLRADSANHTSGIVVFTTHERWYTFPYPIFELADRNFNEWIYDRNADLRRVNLGITFLQKNVRGLNEDLSINLQGGFTRRIDIQYVVPYLDRRQTWGAKLLLSVANNKDVAVRSVGNQLVYKRDEDNFGRERWGVNLQLSKRQNIYNYHNIDFFYTYNRISPFIHHLNRGYFGDSLRYQRFFELRYSLLADHRNVRFFATNGYGIQALISRVGISPYDNLNLWSLRLAFYKYLPLGGRWFFATKIDGELSTPGRQPYLGTRSLGYEMRFVRGYERYVMEGPINVFTRNSLRHRVLSRKLFLRWMPLRQFQHMPLDIYTTAFGDAGLVRNPYVLPENKRLINNLLVGYGAGLNFVTFYDIVFRVEYSRTIHGDAGVYLSFLTDI